MQDCGIQESRTTIKSMVSLISRGCIPKIGLSVVVWAEMRSRLDLSGVAHQNFGLGVSRQGYKF